MSSSSNNNNNLKTEELKKARLGMNLSFTQSSQTGRKSTLSAQPLSTR